jgi:lysophospholipid acyltransferase (LPLAT)-like uncharacterized protein
MDQTTPHTLTWQRRWMLWTVPPLVAMLLRLLHATLRYEEILEEGGRADQPGEASVWCFWHRCLLPAACFFRGRPRAGAGGLRALARAVRDGATAVIPGDGPRGPRYLLKPGVTKLARLTELPVNTFYLLPQRAWVLRSWDALLVPKPFSRVVMAWGRPIPPPESGQREEETRLAVEATLERLRLLAEAHFSDRMLAAH